MGIATFLLPVASSLKSFAVTSTFPCQPALFITSGAALLAGDGVGDRTATVAALKASVNGAAGPEKTSEKINGNFNETLSRAHFKAAPAYPEHHSA